MPPKRTTTRKPAKKAARKKASSRSSKKSTSRGFFGSIFALIRYLLALPFRLVHRWSKNSSFLIRWGLRCTLPFIILGAMGGSILGGFYYLRASAIYDKAVLLKMPERTVIYDRYNQVIGFMHGDNRYRIELHQVPSHFTDSLIAREDIRFRDHLGVDIKGLARSVHVLLTRGGRQGGSTLTMQLADNSFKYKGKTIDGKLLEMALALKIEADFSKDEILELYINRIFWGGSTYGLEAAARTYFEKGAVDLNLSESAMLSGIISAPNAFSPFRHFKRAIKKRDITLASMVQYGFITQAEASEAKRTKIHIRTPERRINNKSYALTTLREELDVILESQKIKMGGLTVKTTLDLDMQRNAEKFLKQHLRKIETYPAYRKLHQSRSRKTKGKVDYAQGALVCLENHSGAILSIVGGRDPEHSQFNRAINARRQIGSVFKPFLYLTAFDKGLKPHHFISDRRLKPNEIKLAPADWNPRNSDGKYKKRVRASEALAKSRNTPSIRVGNFAGIDNVIKTARRAGFEQDIPSDPAIFLGSFSATPMEVAKAYTAFPNDSIIYRPHMIREIIDSTGKVVYQGSGIIWWDNNASKKACRDVSNILQEATLSGTGKTMRSRYGYTKTAAGKTGTTNDSKDGWFAGYTSALTCVVWVGMDDNTTVYKGASGSSLALPVWARFMKAADGRYPSVPMKSRAIIIEPNAE